MNQQVVKLNFKEKISYHSKSEMRKMRKDLQIIFQDPYASINPRQTVRQILYEAMEIQNAVPKEDVKTVLKN